MADVYYAENKLGKKAAIKVLKSELCAISSIKDRFEQEARIMVDVEHKNIRQAYDLDVVNGQPAIIMEYLEGQTLKQLIDRRKLSDDKTKKYFEQCVSALKLTHTKEIVHRDIKPSNIFITQNDEVKILDFGIAKLRESGLSTLTNQMLGTPVYMSPEQVKSPKNVNTKSDVYSLAVTFYHALTGMVPYDSTADSDFEIQSKIVHEDLDLSKVSFSWRDILHPMLIKGPNQRVGINDLGSMSGNERRDDNTQYDDLPSTPKSQTDPKTKVVTPSISVPRWLNYILGCIILSVAVMLSKRGCGSDITSDLILYESDGLYGYKDATGNIVIPSRYEIASAFSDGRAKVTVLDSVYYINESGIMGELLKPTAQSEQPQPDDSEKDENRWQQANSSSTKSAFEQYILDFPSGRYVSDARAKIRTIEAEEKSKSEQADITSSKMDTDGDGLADNVDKCPLVAGHIKNKGCPVISISKLKGALENGVEYKFLEAIDNLKKGVIRYEVFYLDRVRFDGGSSFLSESSKEQIENLSTVLNENPNVIIEMSSHTDDTGNNGANIRLSADRANAVKKEFMKNGIDPSRIKSVGYGGSKPIADNETQEGRRTNNRIEIVIIQY
jgi:serine/threonine protein kinase